MPEKQRLDILLHERGLAESRAKAQGMIMAGEVFVNQVMVDKPGTRFADDVVITVKAMPQYVSRGGDKLAGALKDFHFDVTGRICADVGASTGGFTDCLLQHGASRIYAIDVGYGQLAHKLRIDERVTVMERTNARYVESLNEPVDLVVIDASFISLKLLLPPAKKWLTPIADVIALIKPQFEAGKRELGKGGVVRDSDVHKRVVQDILQFAQLEGFVIAGITLSPLKGPAGNIEFLVWLHQGTQYAPIDTAAAIQQLFAAE